MRVFFEVRILQTLGQVGCCAQCSCERPSILWLNRNSSLLFSVGFASACRCAICTDWLDEPCQKCATLAAGWYAMRYPARRSRQHKSTSSTYAKYWESKPPTAERSSADECAGRTSRKGRQVDYHTDQCQPPASRCL